MPGKVRIELVQACVDTPKIVDDGTPALSLLEGAAELQREMTRVACSEHARFTGVFISETGVQRVPSGPFGADPQPLPHHQGS